jgi:hypothetical protein
MASISVLCSIVELRRNYLAHTVEYRRPRMMRLTLPLLIVKLSACCVVMCQSSRPMALSRLRVAGLTAVTGHLS